MSEIDERIKTMRKSIEWVMDSHSVGERRAASRRHQRGTGDQSAANKYQVDGHADTLYCVVNALRAVADAVEAVHTEIELLEELRNKEQGS